MEAAVDAILSKIRPKIRAMLRTRGQYSQNDMCHQLKIHVWSHMEHVNGCIAHAAPSHLNKLDSAQRYFLNGMDMTEEVAFLDHNLAPPSLRRDIGLLGLLHKRVLGQCHPAYNDLLPLAPASWYQGPPAPRHNRLLNNHIHECMFHCDLFSRSIFGMVNIYNRLPQCFIDCETVSTFQHELTAVARRRCDIGHEHWKDCFSSVHPQSWVYTFRRAPHTLLD